MTGVPSFELGTDGPSAIVVGIDGSTTSLRASAYALGLARRQHSRLVAVYVGSISAMAAVELSTACAVLSSRWLQARSTSTCGVLAARTKSTVGGTCLCRACALSALPTSG